MTMTYTQLTTNIEDICENTFTADQLAMFAQQAEQKIYNTVQLPALRKNITGNTTGTNKYLSVPTDYLHTHSLAIIDASGDYHYALHKDVNFIREAYPGPTDTGMPKHYGEFHSDCLILGPTPDLSYDVELHYGYYPESIVTATTTWLGDNFDSALLNGSLVEALRFMKGEEDLVAMYDKFYLHAISLLKTLGDGKLRRDSYRGGQFEVAVG
jgi:hypothetical protein